MSETTTTPAVTSDRDESVDLERLHPAAMTWRETTALLRLQLKPLVDSWRRTFRWMQRIVNRPKPPPPKCESGMTSRQYRAARRKYGRDLRAWHRRFPEGRVTS